MKGLLALVVVLGFGSAQQTSRVITVNDPRPLAEAIRTLEKVSGQPITYEDPPYTHSADVVDRSDSFNHKPGVKALLPKGGALNFAYMTNEVSDRNGTAKVVERLANTFNKTYPSGAQFSVVDKDGMFHVVRSASVRHQGMWEGIRPRWTCS
jgi:hypothetical protein